MATLDVHFKRDYGKRPRGATMHDWLEPQVSIQPGSYSSKATTYDERRALLVVHMRHILFAVDGVSGDKFKSNITCVHELLEYILGYTSPAPNLTLDTYSEDIERLMQAIAESLRKKKLPTEWVFARTGRIVEVPGEAIQVLIDHLAADRRYSINQPIEPYDCNALAWANKRKGQIL